MRTNSMKNIFGILVALSLAFLLSACSGGGSGGSDSGAGSSSVQGNVSSVSLAMLQTSDGKKYFLADLVQFLLPIKSAHADGGVSGISVDLAGMQTLLMETGIS